MNRQSLRPLAAAARAAGLLGRHALGGLPIFLAGLGPAHVSARDRVPIGQFKCKSQGRTDRVHLAAHETRVRERPPGVLITALLPGYGMIRVRDVAHGLRE